MIAEPGPPVGCGEWPRRILVYGVSGSGKTTLARRLGELTGLPLHAVDDLMWQPGWVQVPVQEQRRRMAEICAGDVRILDHAYGTCLDVVLPRVQLVVGLDFSRPVALARLLRRSVINIVARRPTCNGNVETWSQLFGPNSIVRWQVRSAAEFAARIHHWAADPDGPPVIIFRRPRQVERWLRNARFSADAA
ncbi:MAG TPA: adenylate kinase [Microlunatus sp.]|nr:adenylate kinase [Microlunatus sp.]